MFVATATKVYIDKLAQMACVFPKSRPQMGYPVTYH